MRIALIHIAQETNDFNPLPTTMEDYRSFGIIEGQEVLKELSDVGSIGGYLEAIRESGQNVETFPIIRGFAVAGGRLDKETFEFFQDRIRTGLKEAGKIDGLMLQLHGACAADGFDDVEGEQAELCRRILGTEVPIILALDHHANITSKIIANVDGIVGHRTQPHDLHDTGKLGGEMIIKVVSSGAKPVMAWRKIPLVSHQEKFLTSHGPMKKWFDKARAAERDPKVLQVSNYPMQPWLDVKEGGWSTVVVTDNDQALAETIAEEMAEFVWKIRAEFEEREAMPVDDAVRAADAEEKGLVVISDTGDTVFGGAAGDSNVILESVLRLGIESKVLIPMISKKAVAELVAAGEGAEITLDLGGCTATEFFKPLTVTGKVRKIADGSAARVEGYNHQDIVNMGRVVIFETGPVTLLITELRGVAGNLPSVYRIFGIEPTDYKIAVVKTASNFQFFASITSKVIRADTGGPGQSDVYSLPWKRLPRPIHPLDPVADWHDAHPANRGGQG
ncbi:M81 family metallopeptidase [Maritalea sp.]|uniref:M81 family metallopeptidase n=1 Tax=Maritalea sp. TaxID=2003361 RepID=UPI003EFAAEC0